MLTSGNDRTTRSNEAQKTYFRNQNSFTLTSTRTSNAQIAKNARAVRPLYNRNRFIRLQTVRILVPREAVIVYHHGCRRSFFLRGGVGYPWSPRTRSQGNCVCYTKYDDSLMPVPTLAPNGYTLYVACHNKIGTSRMRLAASATWGLDIATIIKRGNGLAPTHVGGYQGSWACLCAHWIGKLRRGHGPNTAEDSPSPQGRGPG